MRDLGVNRAPSNPERKERKFYADALKKSLHDESKKRTHRLARPVAAAPRVGLEPFPCR